MVGAHTPQSPAPVQPFIDPDPFHELMFPTPLAARHAIADELRLPLAKLSDEDRAFIDRLLAETLSRPAIIAAVRERFPAGRKEGSADADRGDAALSSGAAAGRCRLF